jgi:hypothetical protein
VDKDAVQPVEPMSVPAQRAGRLALGYKAYSSI